MQDAFPVASSLVSPVAALAVCALLGCADPGPTRLPTEAGLASGDGSTPPLDAGPAREGGSPGASASVFVSACGDDNPAGLDATRRATLRAGGPADDLRFVYPYDGTVFPRGLEAPLLMWEGGDGAEAALVQLYDADFAYEGCVVPDAEGRFALPQEVWDRAAEVTGGPADPFWIELTLLQGGVARGPVRRRLVIAPGSLSGSIYYNSYSSALAKMQGASGGAVLRIPAGGEAELFVGQRGCAGCHSASADGRRLITNEAVYALTPATAPDPDPLRNVNTEFPGVSPTGDVFVYQGMLTETDTGIPHPNSGLPTTANELSFSPDGDWVAFIDGDVNPRGDGAGGVPVNDWLDALLGTGTGTAPGSSTGGNGKLARMRYDTTTRTFSDYALYPQVSAEAQWPAHTPDDRAIVYTDTATHDLMILDLASGQTTLLARAMGFDSPQDAVAGSSNLPYADMGEARQAFFPVLVPVAVGGYFWVIFDSPRRYGNVDTTKIASGLATPQGILGALPFQLPGGVDGALASKQLWVAAIEIAADGNYATDRSAPAFYLPGQEVGANNHRAFAALDPCRDAGSGCSSGTQCCSGFCGSAACEPPPTRCSGLEEACTSRDDCCDATHACINGYCSLVNLY